jgi:hypothetical protein
MAGPSLSSCPGGTPLAPPGKGDARLFSCGGDADPFAGEAGNAPGIPVGVFCPTLAPGGGEGPTGPATTGGRAPSDSPGVATSGGATTERAGLTGVAGEEKDGTADVVSGSGARTSNVAWGPAGGGDVDARGDSGAGEGLGVCLGVGIDVGVGDGTSAGVG